MLKLLNPNVLIFSFSKPFRGYLLRKQVKWPKIHVNDIVETIIKTAIRVTTFKCLLMAEWQNNNVENNSGAGQNRSPTSARRSNSIGTIPPWQSMELAQAGNGEESIFVGQPRPELFLPLGLLQGSSLNYGYTAPIMPDLSQIYGYRTHPGATVHRQAHTRARSSNNGDFTINGLRYWENLAKGHKSQDSFIFNVMSFNVLAQDLIDQHPYLYMGHKLENLSWEVRWNNIFTEISNFQPEILCLQEVQGSHIPDYYSQLEQLGYQGIYKQRTGLRTDGCAIYFKYELLDMIEHTTVEYNQPKVPVLDRDNVAIIAKFIPKMNPTMEFVVATTHLLYNPKRTDVRLAQTQLLLAEIDRIAYKAMLKGTHMHMPIIFTGDLNSDPDSAVYQLITGGRFELVNHHNLLRFGETLIPSSLRITDHCQHADLLPKREANELISRSEEIELIEIKHSERAVSKRTTEIKDSVGVFQSGTLSHNFYFNSVYNHGIRNDPEGTTYQDEWLTVDYIFYSNQPSESSKLTLLGRFKLPSRRQLGQMPIPNRNLGSDHLSLLAKFRLDVP